VPYLEQPATLPDVADPNDQPGSACDCPGFRFAEGASHRKHGRQYLCRNHTNSRYYIAWKK